MRVVVYFVVFVISSLIKLNIERYFEKLNRFVERKNGGGIVFEKEDRSYILKQITTFNKSV